MKTLNPYLVTDLDDVALYDAGWLRSWPRVAAAVREQGRGTKDISAIVLTHAHPDHLGAVDEVRQLTGAPVYVRRPEVARAHGSGPALVAPGSCRHYDAHRRPLVTGTRPVAARRE